MIIGKNSAIKGFTLLFAAVLLIVNFGIAFANPHKDAAVTVSAILLLSGGALITYFYRKWSRE